MVLRSGSGRSEKKSTTELLRMGGSTSSSHKIDLVECIWDLRVWEKLGREILRTKLEEPGLLGCPLHGARTS
jgi:hypothetical protein